MRQKLQRAFELLEYLLLSRSGLDVESRILATLQTSIAGGCYVSEFTSARWMRQPLAFSGVTDLLPADPEAARDRRRTPDWTEAEQLPLPCDDLSQKNFLVKRDIDLLARLARNDADVGRSLAHH